MSYAKFDPARVPASYEELFRDYYPYTVRIVMKYGIYARDAQDVASEVMARFLARDFLPKFDADYETVYKGVKRKVQFASFYTNFVELYVRGIRDRHHRMRKRETITLDSVQWDGRTVLEWVTPAEHIDHAQDMEEQLLVAKIRAYLATVPPNSAQDRCDLVALFDQVVRSVRERGTLSVPELAAHFGISSSAGYNWFNRLKVHVQEALDLGGWERA